MRSNNKTNDKNTIKISYLQESLTFDDVSEIKNIATKEKVTVLTHDFPPQHIAGVEQFFPQLKIILSSDLAIGICGGIIANVICDVIKKVVLTVCKKVKEKKLTKIHNGVIEENASPTIHLEIGNIKVILPVEISNEQFQYFADHLFETLKGQNIKKTKYCIFDPETKEYRFLEKHEIVWNDYENHKEK